MGLFKLIFPKPEPVMVWQTEAGLVANFDFDFDKHTLCGIKPGDPASLLWKLGPSEDKASESQRCFNYYSKGTQVEVENGRVASIILYWQDEQQKQFLPFSGPGYYRGQTLALRPGNTEAEIKSIFGEPDSRDEDEQEIVLFYRFGEIKWEVEIDRRGGLAALVVEVASKS